MASSGQGMGRLLNILQCTGQPPTKNYPPAEVLLVLRLRNPALRDRDSQKTSQSLKL